VKARPIMRRSARTNHALSECARPRTVTPAMLLSNVFVASVEVVVVTVKHPIPEQSATGSI